MKIFCLLIIISIILLFLNNNIEKYLNFYDDGGVNGILNTVSPSDGGWTSGNPAWHYKWGYPIININNETISGRVDANKAGNVVTYTADAPIGYGTIVSSNLYRKYLYLWQKIEDEYLFYYLTDIDAKITDGDKIMDLRNNAYAGGSNRRVYNYFSGDNSTSQRIYMFKDESNRMKFIEIPDDITRYTYISNINFSLNNVEDPSQIRGLYQAKILIDDSTTGTKIKITKHNADQTSNYTPDENFEIIIDYNAVPINKIHFFYGLNINLSELPDDNNIPNIKQFFYIISSNSGNNKFFNKIPIELGETKKTLLNLSSNINVEEDFNKLIDFNINFDGDENGIMKFLFNE